ncbi:MAG: 2OG-Fe(II) oxygenase [Proteobacteria bacterium]|nr:2OG-Fe(II) oxygenase [Pseudomonadota bacterium]
MQFVGDFALDGAICDRLVQLHRTCDQRGLVKRGAMSKGDANVVDVAKKDSFDVLVGNIPPELQDEYGIPAYFAGLQRCLEGYLQQHPVLQKIGRFRMTESPSLQHYRPGGGFFLEHFERSGFGTTTRMLVWMTYLNDVTDGGGTRFVYQDHTFAARKGRTLIWPSDFTHTHAGVVSPSQHKYIITGWFNFVP